MKKIISLILTAATLTALLAGCGSTSGKYKDGTYEGKSSVYVADASDEDSDEAANGYGVVTITIKDNKVVDCTYVTYEEDGTVKDEDYGKVDGEKKNKDYYNKAQKAVAACAQYAQSLIDSGDLSGVDCISGATINYDHFKEAVNDALSKAGE